MAKTPQRRRARKDLPTTAAEATLGPLAGALVGYATFGVLATAVAALAAGIDRDFDVYTREWEEIGFAGALGVGVLLFAAFLYGGFVAGRMSRTAGIQMGVATFVAALAIAAVTALLVNNLVDGDDAERLVDVLRAFGMPGSGDEWRQIGTTAAVASLLGMGAGSVLGGLAGERQDAKG